jgi:hypothetical protein
MLTEKPLHLEMQIWSDVRRREPAAWLALDDDCLHLSRLVPRHPGVQDLPPRCKQVRGARGT